MRLRGSRLEPSASTSVPISTMASVELSTEHLEVSRSWRVPDFEICNSDGQLLRIDFPPVGNLTLWTNTSPCLCEWRRKVPGAPDPSDPPGTVRLTGSKPILPNNINRIFTRQEREAIAFFYDDPENVERCGGSRGWVRIPLSRKKFVVVTEPTPMLIDSGETLDDVALLLYILKGRVRHGFVFGPDFSFMTRSQLRALLDRSIVDNRETTTTLIRNFCDLLDDIDRSDLDPWVVTAPPLHTHGDKRHATVWLGRGLAQWHVYTVEPAAGSNARSYLEWPGCRVGLRVAHIQGMRQTDFGRAFVKPTDSDLRAVYDAICAKEARLADEARAARPDIDE